jgi:hypothetical protein
MRAALEAAADRGPGLSPAAAAEVDITPDYGKLGGRPIPQRSSLILKRTGPLFLVNQINQPLNLLSGGCE